MKARAVILDAGGWMPFPVGTWVDVVSMLSTPWPATVIHADLLWWADRASPPRPSHVALGRRWGTSTSTARRLTMAFDSVNSCEQVVNSPEQVVNSPTKVQRGQREPKEQAVNSVEQVVNSCEQVPLENVENPMVFEGLQKQKTEAEDRPTRRVETSSTPETVVPLGAPPAAPSALGPADPATEPDWDALFSTIPLTYDDEATDEAIEDEGPVGTPAGATTPAQAVAGGFATEHQHEVGVGVEGALPAGGQAGPGSLLTPRKRKAPRPAPVGDVETLWEAWRVHGTVRGEPNPKRRGLLARAIEAHGLAAMVDVLDAAHTGDGGYWRHLQGATERNDTPYLSPETLLNGRLVERVERAAQWVEAGRPRHSVEETRAEARAEASTRSLATRATMAWDKTIVPHIGSRMDRLEAVMAAWGDSPKAEEARRAVLGGLREAQGLSAIGMATQFTRPALKRAFVRGFAAALGGTVSEAELLAVG